MKDKGSLRVHYLKLLKEQSKQERWRKSLLIEQRLWGMKEFQNAGVILFYASMPVEVDTLTMIEKALISGKRVALPIVEHDQKQLIPTLISSMEDVHKGTHGVHQPKPNPHKAVALADIDVAIIPGLAFDKHHNRLGRGAGYYDRFLSTLPKTVITVGLAFDFQLTSSLPTEEHDMPLQHIIAG